MGRLADALSKTYGGIPQYPLFQKVLSSGLFTQTVLQWFALAERPG